MRRRDFLAAPAAIALGTSYPDYARCLPDYLRALAAAAYEKRNREMNRLTSPEAIRARQVWVRETLWRLIGGKPERTPLKIRQIGSFDRPGYRVEKIVYESRPELYIPANVYVPTGGTPPYPGILFQMGHSPNGKAADTYQRCCQGLVKLGYLVLAFDPMGQGERVYYPDSSGTATRLQSSDDEHTVPGRQMLLIGETATRMQLWDAIRSLDVLATHPKADPKRLGATGQSGGGTLTMLLLAADDRVSAAVVCSGNTENFACADFNPPGSTDDAEQNLSNSGPAGFDRWDLLYPFAPKPLSIAVSDKDSFGTYSPSYISNGREEYDKLQRTYQTMGKSRNLAWSDTPLPHGLSYDSRLQVYNWFERHLKSGVNPVPEEPPVTPEPDAMLWISKTGNVVAGLGSQTPFTLLKSLSVAVKPASLDAIAGADFPNPGLRAKVLARVPSRDVDIETLDIVSAHGVHVPAWFFLPRPAERAKAVVLVLDPAGRNVRWHEGELYQQLAQRGYAICAADVRGIGDLAPEYGRGSPRYAASHHAEEDYAWASLILGKPLLGQRVTDILALASGLRSHPAVAGKRLVLYAKDKLTVPAQFAMALEPAIQELYLSGGLVSYRSVIESENYSAAFANFCPSILLHTDLPQLASKFSPRKVTLAGVVDASGKTMAARAVRELYPNAIVRDEPDWTFRDLE